ncbi:MAG TPA: ABC transporter ATP-binding protein, partial [Bacilli bacterium]|nr:ABC transporter ATP-binding protein [Bacilli bacterium]
MESIIKLKNVSKFYYSKGVIASGFTKINLDFKMGEFVAITGESGSGKSTLLNVISGLDTYEEGELYINGEETSHYTEKDFEDYRRKYIGNIFQNFNLVNSYTVYQNIELVLLLNGNKKKDIKKKVLDLIRTVDLYRFRNTKVSKLSGGQKQRVAIARALAKETPIIIADEPTGNLDSRSANSIIKLLSEIAKDKLVIVVTHNYEQVEPYVTRKIKMHDGKVLEDKKIKEVTTKEVEQLEEYKNITNLNRIRLGFRNAFNIIPKFLLVFGVYLFITVALMSEYSSTKQDEYQSSKEGYNYYFNNLDDTRVIIKKKDKSPITENDFKEIEKLSNVKEIFKNDLLLDMNISINDGENFWVDGNVLSTKSLDKVDYGRLPANDDEIVLMGNKDDYYIANEADNFMNKEMFIQNNNGNESNSNKKVKIVGIKYNDTSSDYTYSFYISDYMMNYFNLQINQQYSNVEISFMGKYYRTGNFTQEFKVVPNNNVPQGHVYLTESYDYLCPNFKCINQSIYITARNLYYEDVKILNVLKTYNKNNYNSILGLNKDDLFVAECFANAGP